MACNLMFILVAQTFGCGCALLLGLIFSLGFLHMTCSPSFSSPRFEHREENRKDCLRTLFALIEEAGKARKLVEEARISEVKGRLKANPKFMERLQARKQVNVS